MHFNLKLQFIVGCGQNRSGQPIPQSSIPALRREAVRFILSQGFGGVSVYEHNGAWLNDADNLVEENGLSFVVLCNWEQPYSLGEAGKFMNAYPSIDKKNAIHNYLRGLFDQESVISSSEQVSANLD